MDLDAYYNRYTGLGRVKRLAFASSRATGSAQAHALKLAVQAVIADSQDAEAYRSLATKATAAGGGAAFDSATYERLKKNSEAKVAKLLESVDIARARSQRDECRRNLVDLGLAYRDSGDFGHASTALQNAREYAASSRQLTEINTILLEMALLSMGSSSGGSAAADSRNSASALINKLHASPEAETAALGQRLRAASGLIALSEGQYELAAREFLTLPLRFGDSFNSTLHAEEAALYGGLCALATFAREDLRVIVLGGGGGSGAFSDEVIASMRAFLLENAPGPLKEAMGGFVTSKYASCLETLNALAFDHLSLDLFLAPAVPSLITAIRKRALKQYLLPYCNVDLRAMASAFRVPVDELEKEIAELIAGGSGSGSVGGLESRLRIEGEDKRFLQAYSPDPRSLALQRSLETAKEFAADAKQLLLRTSMETSGLFVGHGSSGTAAALAPASSSSSASSASSAAGGGGTADLSSSSSLFLDRDLVESWRAEAARHGCSL